MKPTRGGARKGAGRKPGIDPAQTTNNHQQPPTTTNHHTKMKIAIINTMDRFDSIAGTVLSTHRTMEAAMREDASIQRAVKRHNGQNSYLPTIIVEVDPKARKGMRIHESLIIA